VTRTYPLNPSPIAVMRAKYRLDQPEAARRLALTLGQLKVLEMRTSEVPPAILDVIDVLLGPPPKFTQITVWDALAELDAAKNGEGEGGARA
jgi:DNA-binding transcriptional regulator YiaG